MMQSRCRKGRASVEGWWGVPLGGSDTEVGTQIRNGASKKMAVE